MAAKNHTKDAAHWNLLTDMQLNLFNMHQLIKKHGRSPSPWNGFLAELNRILREPLKLHCIGGFVSRISSACRAPPAISTITPRFLRISTWMRSQTRPASSHETRSLASPCGHSKPAGRLRQQAH